VNFRHLEAFAGVARLGGFTRAAEALYLTQPTVSGQVKELEQELGVSLFHRLPRSVELTEAGRLLLGEARSILRARDRLLEQASAYLGLLSGRLVVHASTIPGEYLLPRHLAAFKRAHPEVVICLRVGSSGSVLDLLVRGEADLGVVGERDESLGLSYASLWSDRVRLYAAPSLPVEEPVTTSALRGLPLVLREEGSGTRRAVDHALGELGVQTGDLQVVAEFGSTSAVKRAIQEGIGAGFLSEIATADETATGTLRALRTEGFMPVSRRFYAAWDGQRALSPAAQAFLALLTGTADGSG
jgi:DNA-binding transcriptional LysR family regulator